MERVGIGSQIEHRSFGRGVVVDIIDNSYTIYFNESGDVKEINRDFDGLSILEKVAPDIVPIDLADIEKVVEKVVSRNSRTQKSEVEMAGKWIGGTLNMLPGSTDLQGKEVPIDTFFNKIIMVRERLRVLEQNINNHEKLNEEDKIHLQQYITRAYGSLTTFNILFAQKEDHFKGMGKS
jgi:hypothetical protein